jgi:hypothetical protein
VKRRTIPLAGLVAVALLTGLTWLIFGNHEPPEPVYQGKPLSFWLWAYDPDSSSHLSESERIQSVAALNQIGTNAIPTLVRMLKASDPAWKVKLFEVLRKQSIIKMQHVEASRQNQEAVDMFRLLGSTAACAVPSLIGIYEQNVSPSSQYFTIESLTLIGPPAKAAIPAIVKGMTNSDPQMLEASIQALGIIHSNPELAVPALIKTLSGPALEVSDRVRTFSAQALGNFGAEAKPAIPALLKIINDYRTYEVGIEAAKALRAIDPEAAAKAGIK